MSRYLSSEELVPRAAAAKTATWAVKSRSTGGRLGRIAWYGPWRQYCFMDEVAAVYSAGCLREIGAHLEEATRARRCRCKEARA